MKLRGLIILSVCVLAVFFANAEANKHRRVTVKRPKIKSSQEVEDASEPISEQEEEIVESLDERVEGKEEPDSKENEIRRDDDLPNDQLLQIHKRRNPCFKKRCGPGKICEVDSTGEATCICIPSCPQMEDKRRKVCSNLNSTWDSDCALHQMRCWCRTGDENCLDPQLAHMHIDYFGPCREIEECTKEMMEDFPSRMRHWLFNVMQDLAQRDELSSHYMKMEMEAEQNLTRRWANSAVWKWCDLKRSDEKTVSRHDLFPIRAPLLTYEQCIAPFLDSCDYNDDHYITLVEWAKCLEIEEAEIEKQCDEVKDRDEDFYKEYYYTN